MKINQLTARKVATVKTPGYYLDGAGLYLQVSKSGTKSWVFRFMLDGRAREMGLGSVITFSLSEARERAKVCRQFIADGTDPIEARRAKRDEQRAQAAERIPFKDAAEEFFALYRDTWRNDQHKQQFANSLKSYAYPTLGMRPVSAIDAALINEALVPIWTKKPETARRVKQRIERVVQWVKDGKPLPSKSAAKRVEHYPAMQVTDIPTFMAELRERDSISARALEFTTLTVARTGDTLKAKWKDLDLDAALWTIPEHKTGRRFEIPLSKRALEILKSLPREKSNPHVFIGARKGQGLSSAAMAELLKGMHQDRAKAGLPAWIDKHSGRLAVVHGFRSSFRDWAGDRTNFAREVIETAMSHKIKDQSEASYRRSSALEKRRKLMEAWAGYCAAPPSAGKVIPLHGAA